MNLEQEKECIEDNAPLITPDDKETSWGKVKRSIQNMMPKKKTNSTTRLTSTPLRRQQIQLPHELHNEVENYIALVKKKKKIEADILHQEEIKWAKKVRKETRRTDMQNWKDEQLSKSAITSKKVSFAED